MQSWLGKPGGGPLPLGLSTQRASEKAPKSAGFSTSALCLHPLWLPPLRRKGTLPPAAQSVRDWTPSLNLALWVLAVPWDMAASRQEPGVFATKGDPAHPTGRKYVTGVGVPKKFQKICALTTLLLAQPRSWHTAGAHHLSVELISGLLDAYGKA